MLPGTVEGGSGERGLWGGRLNLGYRGITNRKSDRLTVETLRKPSPCRTPSHGDVFERERSVVTEPSPEPSTRRHTGSSQFTPTLS